MGSRSHTLTFGGAIGVLALVLYAGAGMGQSMEALPVSEPTKEEELAVDEKVLADAKISALMEKRAEQEKVLAKLEERLAQEQAFESKTFDNNAYFSLSMKNTAPWNEYHLLYTKIFADGKLIAEGGKHNQGLPRADEIFFGAVEPGCHTIEVKATFERHTNTLIDRFRAKRMEVATKAQSFIAKNGYRIKLEIEGFEAANTFFDFSRKPAIRFNRSVVPNFLPDAPVVSADDVLKQGKVFIDYVTEDTSMHRLIEKSVSIDGLPVLAGAKHNDATEGNVVFNSALGEGKHSLYVTLLFGQKKWVSGGPSYNFRLSYGHDFYVVSGQSTIINIKGMPKGGFRTSWDDSRYAKSTVKITSEQEKDLFPELTCKMILEQEVAAKKAKEKEPEVPKAEEQPISPTKGD